MSSRLRSRFTLAALACGVCLFSNAALADVSVSARLHNTGFQLIDLDLNDGITPELVFNVSPWSGGYSYLAAASPNSSYESNYVSYHNLQPSNLNVNSGDSSISTSYSGGGYFADFTAAGSTSSGYFTGTASQSNVFYLTPHTRLVAFGDADGSLNFSGQGEHNAYVRIRASIANWSGTGDYQEYHKRVDGDSFGQPYTNFADHINLTLDNSSNNQMTGYLELTAEAYAHTPAPAVPEPETWAMMVGGLAMLAAIARRRQKQA